MTLLREAGGPPRAGKRGRSWVGSVVAEQRESLAVLDHLAVGAEQAEAADGVEPQLPQEDFAGLLFRPAADGRPVRPGEAGLLDLKLGGHRCPPFAGRSRASLHPLSMM